jgi:hypothetical protein
VHSAWRIEERIKTGKGLAGLDRHQVRRWRSWYRWVTLPADRQPGIRDKITNYGWTTSE